MGSVVEECSSFSSVQTMLKSSEQNSDNTVHSPHLIQLASTILYNLRYQHDWTSLTIHTTSAITGKPLPRPLVSGLPPTRTYVHPDEQVEILKAEHLTGKGIVQYPEHEWVLPTHITERWSLVKFASVFDNIQNVPPNSDVQEDVEGDLVGQEWRGKNRQKRIFLATLHDDSTVVYYIVHDGIVKPRQN